MRTYDEIYHDTMVPMPDDTRENAFDYVIPLVHVVRWSANEYQDTPGMARRVETQESFPSQMPVSIWRNEAWVTDSAFP